jgi:hypothetical protein
MDLSTLCTFSARKGNRASGRVVVMTVAVQQRASERVWCGGLDGVEDELMVLLLRVGVLMRMSDGREQSSEEQRRQRAGQVMAASGGR